jgi:hypothetical protein
MFTPDEIGAHLEQIERAQSEQDVDVLDEDYPLRESPAQPRSESGSSRRSRNY